MSANNGHMVNQKRGQSSAMGHMSMMLQLWQHVSAPNALTFFILPLPDNKKAFRISSNLWILKCHIRRWCIIKRKGLFQRKIPLRFPKAPSVMDCFIRDDLQAYLKNRRNKIKKSVSHLPLLTPHPQDGFRDFLNPFPFFIGDERWCQQINHVIPHQSTGTLLKITHSFLLSILIAAFWCHISDSWSYRSFFSGASYRRQRWVEYISLCAHYIIFCI